MRSKLVIIGFAFMLLAIPAYIITPTFITKAMNKFTFGTSGSSEMNRQIFAQLGMPPIPDVHAVTAFIQYSLIGVMLAGLGIVIFGTISKKMPKSTPLKIPFEEPQVQDYEDDTHAKAIHLLQERLAKGEITSSQYQNLRKMLEEKR